MKKLFSNSPTPELEAWKKEGEEAKLAGKFGLSLISKNFIQPGTESVVAEYVSCRKAPGITVVPILPNGNVMITKTFKQGAEKIVWEFPAGMIVKPTSPSEEAHVELKEESGLKTTKLVELGITNVAPRKFDTVENLYVALDCEILPAGPKPEKDEILELWEMSSDELWELIEKGDGSFSGFSEMAAYRAADKGFIRKS